MVCACRNSSTPLTLQRAGNLLEGAKRGIGNLVFVTLPPKVLRVLRAGVPGESYVKGWHLLPWHVPGPPAVLPLTHCVPSPARSLRSLPHAPSLRSLTGCAPRGSPFAYATTSLSSPSKRSTSLWGLLSSKRQASHLRLTPIYVYFLKTYFSLAPNLLKDKLHFKTSSLRRIPSL